MKKGMMSIHREQLAHILTGCVSDKQGQSMYIQLHPGSAVDLHLPKYKSIRASSQEEGYHYHFNDSCGPWSLSPELMNAKMTNYRDRWNQNAGQKYRMLPDFGHYNLELVDELQRSELKLFRVDPFPSHIATPNIPAELLESFGTARQLDIDLPGVEKMRSVHAVSAAPAETDEEAAASALNVLSADEPESEAQLNSTIRAVAAAK